MDKRSFREYQQLAQVTAIYPEVSKVIYPALGLASEAGEVAGKVKKVLRDCKGEITDEMRGKIKSEIGDTLWYIAALCSDLGLDMGEVAEENLVKLYDRQDRGVLSGSGDNR